MEFFKPNTNYDFVGKNKLYATVSAILVFGSLAAIVVFGLNFGIDFAGGYEIQSKFPRAVTESELAKVLEPLQLGDMHVQRFGSEADHEYLIMVREHGTIGESDKPKLKNDLMALAGGPEGVTNWALAESGESLQITYNRPVTEGQVRDVLGRYKLTVKSIAHGGREDLPDFNVQIVSITDKIEQALVSGLNIPDSKDLVARVEFVGPQVGEQLRNQGILAVVYALLFILLYIAIRFDFYFAPGAIISLVHDVAVTLGVFAIFQLEFNLPAIAAILTLIGYSLNDTVVVYDRVRENLGRMRGRDLRSLINTSINQTLSRTVLTGGSTFLVIGTLLAFGGQSIRDFVIALLVGIIVGTYSSIGVAAPIYLVFKERYAKKSAKASSGVVAA